MFALEFTEDPNAFLRRSGALLGADPVLCTVVATATAKAVDEPAPDHPRWWVTVADPSGTPVGVAMRTAPFAPYPLYVLPLPESAARQLAQALLERGEDVSAVIGALPAAQVLAAELARRTGRHAQVHRGDRLHVLRRLVEPRVVPDGRPRVAVPADGPLVLTWFRAFHGDADAQAGRRESATEVFEDREVDARIAQGRVWLWEDHRGDLVSMVGFNAPSYGVARVGPVYTPGAHRGRGFASALTAHVSRLLRDAGSAVCLFTDQANPTSNKIYAALGYAPVVDMANLQITRRALNT